MTNYFGFHPAARIAAALTSDRGRIPASGTVPPKALSREADRDPGFPALAADSGPRAPCSQDFRSGRRPYPRSNTVRIHTRMRLILLELAKPSAHNGHGEFGRSFLVDMEMV